MICKKEECYHNIISCLHNDVRQAVYKLKNEAPNAVITEIRLRAGAVQTLICGNKTFTVTESSSHVPLILTSDQIYDTVYNLCGGSVYSHAEEIAKGFIGIRGARVGICGKGITKDGIPTGFSEYTSLNIRFHRHIKNAADALLKEINDKGCGKVGGILVISPPGAGKTTFLRSLASALSSGFLEHGALLSKRISIIDERGEIFLPEAFERSCADVISFLPKKYCIELCTRVMTPEYIFCDEIGSADEAWCISECASKGIYFVASCHGKDLSDIKRKAFFKKLFSDGVFSTVCELSVSGGNRSCVIRSEDNL